MNALGNRYLLDKLSLNEAFYLLVVDSDCYGTNRKKSDTFSWSQMLY